MLRPSRRRRGVPAALAALAAVLWALACSGPPEVEGSGGAPTGEVAGADEAAGAAEPPAADGEPGAAPGGDEAGTVPDEASAAPPSLTRDPANVARLEDGEIVEAPTAEDYQCLQPRLEIPRDAACETGAVYPGCRWQLPDDEHSGGLYVVWRNTTPEHRWAQPGLVSLALAAAREYAERWPGMRVTIGDLDAPGPRHQTHDRGHDVDLYLEHAMLRTNIGGGHYLPTYEGRPAPVVRLLRAQVQDLARILATCSRGHLRIYYNDPEIIVPFLSWFEGHGMVSDVGPAMVEHNRLHEFHFHMTIADNMEPLPLAP